MDTYQIIEQLCQYKGVTCREMARDIGISLATPSDWKRKKSKPSFKTAMKIAEYFQVPMSCFWTNEKLKQDTSENAAS